MNALLETLLTALFLSALAALCLKLLPHAPPRVRFAVAAAGLSAWLVPWGALSVAWPSASFAAFPAALSLADSLRLPAVLAAAPTQPSLDALAVLGYGLAAASLLGLALLVGDAVALRHCLRRWRATSRPGDELRALLPAELAAAPVPIRVVHDSDVAATSGWFRPTIWIGDRYTGERLEVALVHEMCHARCGDPFWLLAVAALRRAYWWNPIVTYLARQAVLMIESACDHRSAAHLGKRRYVVELASLLLAGAATPPRLVATVHAANLDVQRLRLLDTQLRLRARDLGLLAAIGIAGAAAAMTSVIEPARAPQLSDAAGVALPATRAGNALATLLRAVNGHDAELLNELLGAYTPQELQLPLPRAAGELRVVDVLRSEPLRIEYVVEDGASGARHTGALEVAATGAEVTATQLGNLP